MSDVYLDLAVKIFRYHKKPLSAKEIMRLAGEQGILPHHIYGKTQHKTLQARLSEHILENRSDSLIFRTAPGRFFLREFIYDPSIDSRYRKEFHARRRRKDLTNENVLVVPRCALDKNDIFGIVEDPNKVLSLLASKERHYVLRKRAENDYDLKQFVTYVIITKGTKVLTYRRGKFSNAGKEIMGARSIGFGGHVSDKDTDFLDQSTYGIKNNATRELLEELYLEKAEQLNLFKKDSLRLFCFLNCDETQEAKKHVAAVLQYFCTPNFEPKKGELSINDLNWLNIQHQPNHLDDFELWSKIIIEKFGDPAFRDRFTSAR